MMRGLIIVLFLKITFFFLFFLLFSLASSSLPSSYLPRGSSLSVKASDVLISPDKTFSCGFHTTSSNTSWFAIWFTNSKEKTVVWMANRDNPVNGRGSRLTLREDGTLVLTDLDGSEAWEVRTSSLTSVDKAELLDSGNLVIKDSTSKILWQSFDFPTTTLLPGQSFTRSSKLISQLSPDLFGSGYYSFFFDIDNVLKMEYDGPEISSIYWPNPDYSVFQNGRTEYNSSRIAVLDDSGYFISSDGLEFSASDIGLGIKRRLKIDHDGNLRLYSWEDSSGLWTITWEAVARPCDVHGLCGRNGICTYTPEPRCSCPPLHEPANTDWSKGCQPKFIRNCSDSGFIELPHASYFGFDLNFTEGISFLGCQKLCLEDCRCQGFQYRNDNLSGEECLTKSALFNGHRAEASIYLRVPTGAQKLEPGILNVSHLSCAAAERPKLAVSSKWVYLYSFVGGLGGVEVIILVASWFFFPRRHGISKPLEDGYQTLSSQFRSFSYTELKKSTGMFKQVVGTGGFGTVYKGVLADEREVAVKKLENLQRGEEEFWAEVSIFGRINHMNLVRMWGFCSEAKYRLLVYEYIPNRSLDKHLFLSASSSNALLGWKERFKIALGTAKGLAYLHHECLEWIIHCDVKPENILLDSDFEPKISDFGLAKLCQRGNRGLSEISKIRGTKGYMAPEWTTNLPLTAKVDVYSYGVVILELVRGFPLSRCPANDHHGEEDLPELTSIVRLARGKMQDGEESWMEDLVDQRLEGKFSRKQSAKMIEIGLSCVEKDRNKRPTMEAIALALAECEAETSTITADCYQLS